MEAAKKCLSLNKEIMNDPGSVIFVCPSCEKAEIVRSKQSRAIAARYTCPSCGFSGPN